MGSLLSIISSICKHSATSLSVDLVTSLAEIAVNELIGKTENEAAELLIELCKIHCMQATGGLLTKYVLIIFLATIQINLFVIAYQKIILHTRYIDLP